MNHADSLRRVLAHSAAAAMLICTATAAIGGQMPSDVRASHWAAAAVEQVLKAGVMSVQEDHLFHGEAHVTHIEAVVALAAVARKLEDGSWPTGTSTSVPTQVEKTLDTATWKSSLVTRYQMASVLARLGNYFAKAVRRPGPGAKDLHKSIILDQSVKIPVPAGSPAYNAYKFLTDERMISASSPLLKADSMPLKAAELSKGVSDAVAGVNDRLTEMGHNDKGETPDSSFHNKKPGAR